MIDRGVLLQVQRVLSFRGFSQGKGHAFSLVQLQGSEVAPRNNHLCGLLCTQQNKMGSSFAVKIYISLFLGFWCSPSPCHTQCGYSSFFGQQLPSLTHHMFYCPLKHNAPLLFDIELFIYFYVPPVSPHERLATSGLLRHDLGGY